MITYRRAVLSDVEKLAEIRSVLLKELGNISEEERVVVEQANLEYFRKSLCENTFVSWIALDNDEIIATSGLSFSEVPPFSPIIDGKSRIHYEYAYFSKLSQSGYRKRTTQKNY